MDIFKNGDYKYISNLIEEKIPILRKNQDFENKYTKLSDAIENLESDLSDSQKEQFDEIIKLFYETEKYYFALSYSLGVKFGKDLNEI